MNKKKKIFIAVGVSVLAAVVVAVCLVLFLPKGGTESLPHEGSYVYDYTTGKYNKFCKNHSGELISSILAGSEEYPLLIKDEASTKVMLSAIDSDTKSDTIFVKLSADVTLSEPQAASDFEGIVIGKGKKVCIDLNGKTLLDEAHDTIVNNGDLTILDSSETQTGRVDCSMWETSAVINNEGANFTLVCGTLCRSYWGMRPNEQLDSYPRGEGYYVFVNFGTAVIEDGEVWAHNGNIWEDPDVNGAEALEAASSPLIQNGFAESQTGKQALLTIHGGSFLGGKIIIENCYNAKLQIDGGNFETGADTSEKSDSPMQEYVFSNETGAEIEITGGRFVAYSNANGIIENSGNIAISGGEFVADSCKFVISAKSGTITIDDKATLSGLVTTDSIYENNTSEGVTGEFKNYGFSTSQG